MRKEMARTRLTVVLCLMSCKLAFLKCKSFVQFSNEKLQMRKQSYVEEDKHKLHCGNQV